MDSLQKLDIKLLECSSEVTQPGILKFINSVAPAVPS